MATLATRAAVAANTAFRSRVMMAALTVASQVFAEPETAYEHASRMNYARLVVSSPTDQQIQLAAIVCLNDTIVDAETAAAGSSSDTDIINQVTSMWNELSGVSSAE